MTVKVLDKEIDIELSIQDYIDLLGGNDIPSFLKRLLGDDYADLTQRDRVQFEVDLASELNDLKPENLDHKEMEWNGYRLPESLDDTTMRQEEDLRLLYNMVKAEKGEDMTDFDMYAPALAVYAVKWSWVDEWEFRASENPNDDGRRPEPYDSNKVMERLDEMRNAPIRMAIAWQFFFLLQSPNMISSLLPYFPDLRRSLTQNQKQDTQDLQQSTAQ